MKYFTLIVCKFGINIINYLTVRYMNRYKYLIVSCCQPACCFLA